MADKTNLGSVKRFGTRYGPRNKEKLATLENEHRGKHKCPFCSYVKVKRVSSKGIWQCEKCNAKFTGRAYGFTQTKKGVVEAPKEEVVEETEEEYTEETEEEAA
jgi:large subunit ribosomal protein L37Ae